MLVAGYPVRSVLDHPVGLSFLEIRAGLIGPIECRCGAPIEPTTEYETYGSYGYQWFTGRCKPSGRDHVAFGSDDLFVQSKRRDLQVFYTGDRFALLVWHHQVRIKRTLFSLVEPRCPYGPY